MRIHHTRFAGKEAGTISKAGYREVKLNGSTYKSHRILWKIANGFDPDMIDHIDGNRLNNRHDNLRLATRQENGANRGLSCNNKSGYKGVAWHTRDMCWDAYITVDGERIVLGRSETYWMQPRVELLLKRSIRKSIGENHEMYFDSWHLCLR